MNNINLLPPDIKNIIEQKKKNGEVLGYIYRALLFLILITMLTLGLYLYLQTNEQKILNNLSEANSSIEGYGLLEERSTKISDKLITISKIDSKLYHWADIIAEIQKVMPSGTYLSEASLNSDSKVRGTMSGFSQNKESIAALRNAMELSDFFEFVDIETTTTETSATTGSDMESFTISFSLAKGALDE